MKFAANVVVLVACWLLVSELVYAQAPTPGQISPEQYGVTETRNHMVAMRDGVHLAVDVYQPDAPGKHAAILSLTPYGKAGSREEARRFARRGYVVAVADLRGRYDSEGEWNPISEHHPRDGHDVVEWMAKQAWSNGRVGMMGFSFVGWTQWWTAREHPPALKAIAPMVSPPDGFANVPYQDGVVVGWMTDWFAQHSGRVAAPVGEGPYGGYTARRAKDLMHTPYVDINKSRGIQGAPWFEDIYRRNLAGAEIWKAISYQGKENFAKITVPSLNATGWFDVQHSGAPSNYIGMKQFGATPDARRPILIIGPWQHSLTRQDDGGRAVGPVDYGPEAPIDLRGYTIRFFDHYLKGIDNGVANDPRVYVFVMGANKWHAEKDWPLPQTQYTKYYFSSGGKANSLNGDGVLSIRAPARAGTDTYVYDPARPTMAPYKGGHTEDGAIDVRPQQSGSDVLVYTTPPLGEDVEVTGPIELKLYAATSARDTDWIVHLSDVAPDGTASLLAEGVLRARSRDPDNAGAFNAERLSTIEPGRVYEYTVKFWRATGNLFAKGHRIRVDLSSSYYPFFLRNLNTGADNLALVKESEAVVATQTVHHGGRNASHIVLPVIPRRTTLAAN
ncbi:MAG: CocE/NonD family hydrolase [Rhodospirillaceae bacterium]